MKYLLIILCCLLFMDMPAIQAQQPPIRVSYFGSFLIRPGLKLGTEFTIKTWEQEDTANAPQRTLVLSPQLGIYTWPNTHTGTLLNTALLYKTQKPNKKTYSAFGFQTGLLYESVVESVSISLGNGNEQSKNRSNQLYIVPAACYEWGGILGKQLGWFSSYSLGMKLASGANSAMTAFVEVGMRYRFTNTQE